MVRIEQTNDKRTHGFSAQQSVGNLDFNILTIVFWTISPPGDILSATSSEIDENISLKHISKIPLVEQISETVKVDIN